MKFHPLSLEGAYVIESEPRVDRRGSFTRLFCEHEFKEIGFASRIVNVNFSFSLRKGTLRGLHFQKPPKAENKIVRCMRGAVLDIIVDVRCRSKTFLKWEAVELTDANGQMLLVPEGFAHGFQTLCDNVEFLYFVTEFYSPQHEDGFRYDDPTLNIAWPLEPSEVSLRDRQFPFIHTDYRGLDIPVPFDRVPFVSVT